MTMGALIMGTSAPRVGMVYVHMYIDIHMYVLLRVIYIYITYIFICMHIDVYIVCIYMYTYISYIYMHCLYIYTSIPAKNDDPYTWRP